ncbi:MAG: C-GCAxxG-C-C family protein [Spirochaetales bacterium]|uniref:C-GCAxxG-C-C family protein n=1 Tax=Candidatus Thalassospirochaeta sargassi TaxID=3119039 RepID=A0AAJ1IE71_9SPIO|nr:C-GCAxxG-C-C family protein [Spirochaetales bacterium]
MEKKNCEECFKYYNSGGSGGFNCAESTMYGVSNVLGLDTEKFLPMASPFGGGIGRNGKICGSLVVGMMLLGNKFGRNDPDMLRAPAYEAADKLLENFQEKFGNLNCRELTGLDLKAIDNTGEEKQRVHHEVCRPIVKQVCEWVTEMYEEADK